MSDDNIIIINESSLDPKDEKSQLRYTQSEGYKNLKQFLFDSLLNNQSSEETNTSNYCSNKKENFTHQHNTIFVNGKRGSGKTQFLLSIENYINKTGDSRAKEFYFFQPIDPTLLHDNENFLTIILAKILNNLEQDCRLKELSKESKKEFYQLLSEVSQAIDGTIVNEKNIRNSLEDIAQDQTSLKLAQLMHKFFDFVLKIQNKKKLIILIDDIDMALNKGFEVLEVIRKYLSSPNIVPIVTGDIELYTPLVENHFLNSLTSLKENLYPTMGLALGQQSNNSKKENIINILLDSSTDYLIKVFPMHRRIQIKTFWELAEGKIIHFEFNNEVREFTREKGKNLNDKSSIKFNITFDSTIKDFKDELTENLFKLSARSIIQIFKRELTDNPKDFLTNIENIKKILSNYNYEILSIENMINKYKELIDKDITKQRYDKAKTTLKKVLKLNQDDYTLFDQLGLVNYQIITKYNRPIGEDKKLEEAQKLYQESIQAYTISIELYETMLRHNILISDSHEHISKKIKNNLANSYLELFEYYLTNNLEKEYTKEVGIFLKYFIRDHNVFIIFKMFDTLFNIQKISSQHIIDITSIEDLFKQWTEHYTTVSINWDFQELYLWAKKEKDNALLEEYVNKFENKFLLTRKFSEY